jgi:hypothetical protein
MSSSVSSIEASSQLAQQCPDFNNIALYKKLAALALAVLPLKKQKWGKIWKILAILTVLIYSWLRGVSIHHASEKLNLFTKMQNPILAKAYDTRRNARATPHQTTINRWLAKLSLHDLVLISQVVYDDGLNTILAQTQHREIVVEFDSHLQGYWGIRRDNLIKGTILIKGTHHTRQYHAALIHFDGFSQYVALHQMGKGESLLPFMIRTCERLQHLGFKIKWVLADREYYQEEIYEFFHITKIHLISPSKEYSQLKAAKIAYLEGKKGRVQQFVIAQATKKGQGNRKTTRCWIVLLAERAYHLGRIRIQYQRGQITLTMAMDHIFGLLTTRSPSHSSRMFPALIQKYYRTRWQIETAFREYEVHKAICRSNYDGTRFFYELGRYLLYNSWQYTQHIDIRGKKLTLQNFRDEIVDFITKQTNL